MDTIEDMNADEIQAEIFKVETDPYFMTHSPKDRPRNLQYHESLLERRDKLYAAKYPEPTRHKEFDDDGNDITPIGRPTPRTTDAAAEKAREDEDAIGEAAQEALQDELGAELDLLQEACPDADYDEARSGETTCEHIDCVRTIRLAAQGEVQAAGKLLIESAEAAARMPGADQIVDRQRIEALKMYVSTVRPDEGDALEFLADTARKIYKIRMGA